MLGRILQYIADPQNTFAQHTIASLELCAIPILLSLVISLPIGVLVAQRPLSAFLASNLSGLARALPTYAVLLVIVLWLKQIAFVPSIIALTALGIPPILLNTIAGLRGIDPATLDAARGMGMTRLQLLTRIRIPLILPVVAAGVRTAAVQIVATIPLAGLIGAGGYGEYINLGFSGETKQVDLLVGALSVAVLALLVEGGFALLQRAVTPVGLRAPERLVEAEPAARTGMAVDQPLAA